MIAIMHQDSSELGALFQRCAGKSPTIRSLMTGDALFWAGQPVHSLYVIVEGAVSLVRAGAEGQEITLYTARGAEWVAEPSLFADGYHCDAYAVSPTSVAVYPREAVLQGLRSNPDMALQITARMAQLVQATRTHVALVSLNKARDRVLRYIQLAQRDDTGHVAIHSNWKAVATELALTHEAIYRALARLEREGVIQRKGKGVWLT